MSNFERNKKLIYIAGGGHSGTTIIDLLISSSEEVFTIGEGNRRAKILIIGDSHQKEKENIRPFTGDSEKLLMRQNTKVKDDLDIIKPVIFFLFAILTIFSKTSFLISGAIFKKIGNFISAFFDSKIPFLTATKTLSNFLDS